jgi:hypothetical protein
LIDTQSITKIEVTIRNDIHHGAVLRSAFAAALRPLADADLLDTE